MNITNLIWEECDKQNILVDKVHSPIKVGPDCYLFYGTPLYPGCRPTGDCRNIRYYALTGGQEVRITQ